MGLVPDVGRDEISEIVADNKSTFADKMAVGSDSTSPSGSDTSLGNQLYKASTSDTSVSITSTNNTGEFEATITVNGGTEVPANSDIREYGVFTDSDVLLYRNTVNKITVEAGEEVTITASIDVTNN